eukprot:5515257-Pleurochrysis_carterae.AAC.1
MSCRFQSTRTTSWAQVTHYCMLCLIRDSRPCMRRAAQQFGVRASTRVANRPPAALYWHTHGARARIPAHARVSAAEPERQPGQS